MRCGIARSLLPLLLDRRISLDDYRRLGAHLDQCPRCVRLKVELESPLPPLPSLSNETRDRLFLELDHVLNERVAALAADPSSRRSIRDYFGVGVMPGVVPWSLTWASGVLIGAVATWILLGAPSVTTVVFDHVGPDQTLLQPIVGDVAPFGIQAAFEPDGKGLELFADVAGDSWRGAYGVVGWNLRDRDGLVSTALRTKSDSIERDRSSLHHPNGEGPGSGSNSPCSAGSGTWSLVRPAFYLTPVPQLDLAGERLSTARPPAASAPLEPALLELGD